MGRRWLERGVIAAAALATIATSKPRWYVSADLPAQDRTRARVMTVEATQPPEITIRQHGVDLAAVPLAPATWPGRARYLVPTDALVDTVAIRGDSCQGGGFVCKRCEVPAGEGVTVTFAPATTWMRTAHTPLQDTMIPPKTLLTIVIDVESTHRFRAWPEAPATDVGVALEPSRVTVSLVNRTDAPASASWLLRLASEDACPDLAVACEPPPGARLAVTKIHEAVPLAL